MSIGERQKAVAVLRAVLPHAVPAATSAQPELIVAATVYAAALHAHRAGGWLDLRWARFAYHGAVHTFGADHRNTLRAALVLAEILAGYHLDVEAIGVRRWLLDAVQARAGHRATTTVAARAVLAFALHTAGHCTAGIEELTSAWTVWSGMHGTADRSGVVMLLQLAELLDSCGRHLEASERVAQAYRCFNEPAGAGRRPDLHGAILWRDDILRSHAALCTYARRRSEHRWLTALQTLHRNDGRGNRAAHADRQQPWLWRELLP